ncbi:hypothetical protein N7493_005574 [Penicillium malachiteum]|uniref:Uncharacterized protein n=1 Tax=Penicillium malachiteum TaxID=1324776 RepID=A0AAD6MWP3_9EURO|nr:hypothetical protein N7493_005574 [Penicillium malachiteum]
MALSYPEGECFFKRSGLKTPYYDANNAHHFYGHFMLEYIWNRPAFHGRTAAEPPGGHYHPRSSFKVVKGDFWDTHYGAWSNIFIMYGKKPCSDYGDLVGYRMAKHNLCVSGNRFRDQERGASLESFFMVLPMPKLTDGEEWLLIDRTASIRAIYIPVAQQASEEYTELCTFQSVNFAMSREVRIMKHSTKWYPDFGYEVLDGWDTLNMDATIGLPADAEWTMAVNIPQLVNLLSVPRFLRKHTLFSAQIIRMVGRDMVSTKGNVQTFSNSADISWTTIVNANFGLTVQWAPPSPSAWLMDFIKNSVTIALGFIPVIGPIAAVAFPLAFTAIADPANFHSTLRGVLPQAELIEHIIYQITKSTNDQKGYLSDSWRKSIEDGGSLFTPATSAGTRQTGPAPSTKFPEALMVVPKPAESKAPVQQAKPQAKVIPQKEPTISLPKPSTGRYITAEAIKKRFASSHATQTRKATAEAEEAISRAQTILATSQEPQAEPEPLSELVTSAQFQLADRTLRRSGEGEAFGFNQTGSTDNEPAETLAEYFPKNPLLRDENVPENDYSWMESYLEELWFGFGELADDGERDTEIEETQVGQAVPL